MNFGSDCKMGVLTDFSSFGSKAKMSRYAFYQFSNSFSLNMEKPYPWMEKCHPWMSSIDGEMSSVDESVILGCHPRMTLESLDVIHGWN